MNAFSHEDLIVYRKALSSCANVISAVNGWDAKQAISDHLPRAAESVIENLASACVSISRGKLRSLDYSIGSVLECAACLDIALIKGLLSPDGADRLKREYSEMVRMLAGLKKAWSSSPARVRENHPPYGAPVRESKLPVLFYHERLEAYTAGLDVIRWLSRVQSETTLPSRHWRRLDSLSTGIILNIAESNGRFSVLDHRRFLGTAYESAVKMAAQLDLCVAASLLTETDVGKGKALLLRVGGMTSVMARGKKGNGDRGKGREVYDEVHEERDRE